MLKIIKYASVQSEPVVIKHRHGLELVKELAETQLHVNDRQVLTNEADKIVREARELADKIIENAAREAEIIKKDAYESSRQQGYQEGYNEGVDSGRKQIEHDMQKKIGVAAEEALRIVECAEQTRKESIIGAEREIVLLALEVARKILAREIEENPMVVLPMVKTALEKVRDQDLINIRVNPQDFDLVIQAKRDLQMMIGRENAVTITGDHTVTPGGCLIDTPYGTVDATIDTQFESLRRAIEEVIP